METARLIELHSEQCSRLVHGQCSTRACLLRGGWSPGAVPVNFDIATCPERETVLALERLEKAEDALDSIRVYGSDTLSGRADGPADAQWYRDAVREMRNRASLKSKEEANG